MNPLLTITLTTTESTELQINDKSETAQAETKPPFTTGIQKWLEISVDWQGVLSGPQGDQSPWSSSYQLKPELCEW